MSRIPFRFAIVASAALLLAACADERQRVPARALAPVPPQTVALFSEKNVDRDAPILLRAFKKEAEIELWKQNRAGEYVFVKAYPVCRWSGQLGPKQREGDRQVPEGFYTVSAAQMNPNSSFWLSFNVGYPNVMERAMGRTGGDIMVHGACSSRGCFAMTNDQMEEIYAVMREAFQGGQRSVQFQSFPFRMTPANLAKFRHDPHMPFWRNLKEGSDHFEATRREPAVAHCGRRYVFNARAEGGSFEPTGACPRYTIEPSVAAAVEAKQRADDAAVATLIERGAPAIRVQFTDGNQHPSFRGTSHAASAAVGEERVTFPSVASRRGGDLGEVSRPEAIGDITEIHLDSAGRPKAVAAAPAAAPASAVPSPAVSASARAPAAASAAAPAAIVTAAVATQAPAPTPPPQNPSAGQGLFSGVSSVGGLFGASTGRVDNGNPADAPFYKRVIRFGAPEPAPMPVNAPLPPRRQAALEGPVVR